MAATGKNNKLLLQRVKRITGQKISQPRIKAKFIFFFLFSIIAGCITQFQFKIIPAVFRAAASPTQNKKNNNEILQTVYLSSPASVKNKLIKISRVNKEKNKPETDDAEVNNSEDENLAYINNDQADDQTANENVVSANQSEVVNFSVPAPRTNELQQESVAQSAYPYVPKSSFSFETVPDTPSSENNIWPAEDMNAKEAMKNSLKVLEEIDWKKIENEMSNNEKNIAINIKRLKTKLNRYLTRTDLQKINKTVESSSNDLPDENRVKGDIQIQMDALDDLQSKNLLEAQKLQEQILQNQIKLRQTYIRKQQLMLKKINTVKRTLKIVEI